MELLITSIDKYLELTLSVVFWYTVLYILIAGITLLVNYKFLKEQKIEEIDIGYRYYMVCIAYVIGYINWNWF